MHDSDVTQALGNEIESLGVFNQWMLANMQNPDRTQYVQDAVRQVTHAHDRVIQAHRVWVKDASNKGDLVALCIAFGELVASLIDGDIRTRPSTKGRAALP